MAVVAGTRERLVLNPGPGELDLNHGPVRVAEDGPDWGEAAIEQATADAARGTIPVDFRLPNRQITIPLLLGANGPTGFPAARAMLQNHVARIQAYGGTLWRGGGEYASLTADLVDARLKLPERWAFLEGLEVDVVLTLEAIPDFYGAETGRPVHESTGAELVFTEHGIRGDYPGRVRIVITDKEGQVKNGLLWGIRSRYYDPAPTAKLMYPVSELESLGPATMTNSATWTPLWALAGPSTNFTHRGTYRVWAHASASQDARLRLAWGLGDLSAPIFNTAAAFPGVGQHYLLDLGEVRLDPAPLGRHHWLAHIQGIPTYASATIALSAVYLQPVAELAGRAWVPPDRPAVTVDPDAVLPANASVELRTDGIWREETHGIHAAGIEPGYLPASHVTGDLPRICPGSNEVFLRVSHGDLDRQPDPELPADTFEAQIYYRPSYLNPLQPVVILPPAITSPVHGSRIQIDTPPVAGTGQPGNTVEVTIDGEPLATATVSSSGAWTAPLADPLEFATHTIAATQIDPAQNISEPVAVTFTIQIWSWQELIDEYGTWTEVMATFSTWSAVVRRET